MHHKQDRASRSMASMSKEVDTAKARLDSLEEVTHHHNVAHKAAIARMDELEKELQVLKARASRTTGEIGARVDPLLLLSEGTGIALLPAPDPLTTRKLRLERC